MQYVSEVVEQLLESYKGLGGINPHLWPKMPSRDGVIGILKDIQSLIFPGFHEEGDTDGRTLAFMVGERLNRISLRLVREADKSIRYARWSEGKGPETGSCHENAECIAESLIRALPELRRLLLLDVEATFAGDPAAKSLEEVILSYPGIEAITTHRIAHTLYKEGLPLIPRMMSEYVHSRTGIDIHPGASIGESFFIDHGTGIVVGETAVIGKWVTLYQGVTIGARSVKKEESGIKRHPTIEDHVTIYAGATILGGSTVIGEGSVIGGNVWITESVPPGTRVYAPSLENVMKRKACD